MPHPMLQLMNENRVGVIPKHVHRPPTPCPKHGRPYVLKRGTNRCPKGRKQGVNCV